MIHFVVISATVCSIWDVEAHIRMHTTVQQLMGFGGPVIKLDFPEIVYPFSNLGRVFALCSRVKKT